MSVARRGYFHHRPEQQRIDELKQFYFGSYPIAANFTIGRCS
tara:strand:- start:441 stop:566 length:126 start_codon:yes stop_codon:yes gene_type:complete